MKIRPLAIALDARDQWSWGFYDGAAEFRAAAPARPPHWQNGCGDRDYVAGYNAGFTAARDGRDTSSSKIAYFTALIR